LVVLGFIAIVWVIRALLARSRLSSGGRLPAGDPGEEGSEPGGDIRYPAVSIRTFRNGCPAAEALKGQRFLPEEAPPLPLPDCKWARCTCQYAHHVDRRTGNVDRRRMIGDQREYPMSIGQDDPRATRGRRHRDGNITQT
jgi:hypothetical protein